MERWPQGVDGQIRGKKMKNKAFQMRTELRKLEKYCVNVKWKLEISEPKTVYTIFTTSKI